jgi:hypothetical protein
MTIIGHLLLLVCHWTSTAQHSIHGTAKHTIAHESTEWHYRVLEVDHHHGPAAAVGVSLHETVTTGRDMV